MGASTLLRKYLMLLCAHVADVLPIAASLATCSEKHFALIAQIIAKDVSGMSPSSVNFFTRFVYNNFMKNQSYLVSLCGVMYCRCGVMYCRCGVMYYRCVMYCRCDVMYCRCGVMY